jgi:hypothetical protein
MRSLWTDEQLDGMRLVGDPPADRLIATLKREGNVTAVNDLLHTIVRNDDLPPDDLPPKVRDFLETTAVLPAWTDPAKLKVASQLFERHGPEIVMLLFCRALPMCYGAAKGAQALYVTQQLTHNFHRRIFETAQFVLDVMLPGSFAPDGRAVRSAQKVRLLHAALRYYILHAPHWREKWDDSYGYPINQEDMLGTLMAFGPVVTNGLEMLRLRLTADEAEAYLHAWNVIGVIMGIPEEILPANLAAADDLTGHITRRHWQSSVAGQELTKVLVEFMEYHIPGNLFDGLAATTIRYCSGDELSDMLAVPPADWTARLLGVKQAIFRWDDSAGQISPAAEKLMNLFSRKLIEGIIWIRRGGQRSQFRIPTATCVGWGVTPPTASALDLILTE